jgi:cold shock CspA family protein
MKKRRTGIVTYANPVRTYGFIREDASGIEFFFHYTNVVESFNPEVATRVEFETAPPIKIGKREQAVRVRPIGSVLFDSFKSKTAVAGGEQ